VSLLVSTLEVSAIAFLGGLPVSIPLSVAEVTQVGVGSITPMIIVGVLYLGLVSTALAMYLWNKSLAILEAGLVAMLFFAQPVVGVALGSMLLNEELSPSFWLGSLFILLGLLLAARPATSVNTQVRTG
jgi:drug/metabolite transporter (DMT)-like permease